MLVGGATSETTKIANEIFTAADDERYCTEYNTWGENVPELNVDRNL
jgi:hypothetical protein